MLAEFPTIDLIDQGRLLVHYDDISAHNHPAVACGQNAHLSLNDDRERLHFFPQSGRQRASLVKLLLEPRRQPVPLRESRWEPLMGTPAPTCDHCPCAFGEDEDRF